MKTRIYLPAVLLATTAVTTALSAESRPVLAAPKKAVCAVCKEGEEPVKATAKHAGKEYYFCSTNCRDQFVKDPAAYLTAEEPGAKPGAAPGHQHADGPQGVSPPGGAGGGRSAAPS